MYYSLPIMKRAHIAWAVLAGLVSGVTLWALVPARTVPRSVDGVFGTEVARLDVLGGVRIVYRPVHPASPEQRAEAVRILGKRALRASSGARVADDESTLTAIIPGLQIDRAESLAYALTRDGTLSIHLVRNGESVMERLCSSLDEQAQVDAQPRAITCGMDVWSHEIRGDFRDLYLRADERAALTTAVASMTAKPGQQLDEGLRVAHERIEVPLGQGGDRAGDVYWRTYLIESEPIIDHRDIAGATAVIDPISAQPAVIVTLHRAGSVQFAEATKQYVGRKLAILFGDTVISAPTVFSEIAGGQLMITMGATSRQDSRSQAEYLANSLNSATGEQLPVGLQVVDIAAILPTLGDGELATASLAFSSLAGAIIAVLVWLSLTVSARFGEPWLRPLVELESLARADKPPWLRLLVTIGAILGVRYSAHLLLSSINPEELENLAASAGSGGSILAQFSVFALGITPIISAFVLVEMCALAVPRWRPLRQEGRGGSGRVRLLRAVVALSIALALVQGYAVSMWLTSLSSFTGPIYQGVMSGYPDMLFVALTLTGGVMVIWVAATLVSRHGLGNGFSVLVLASVFSALIDLYHQIDASSPAAMDLFWFIAIILAVVLATSLVLRLRIGGPHGLRTPTSGVVPLIEIVSLFSLIPSVLILVGDNELGVWLLMKVSYWLGQLSPGTTGRPVLFTVLLVTLTGLFSWLFSRPRPLSSSARLVESGPADNNLKPAFWLAAAVSAGYLLAVSWLYRAVGDVGLHVFDLVLFIAATAVVMDLVGEWRARRYLADPVTVWLLHQVQAADLVLGVLAKAEIPAHARTRYHRALLYFFGPYLPIEIMVARSDRARARSIVGSLFGDEVAVE